MHLWCLGTSCVQEQQEGHKALSSGSEEYSDRFGDTKRGNSVVAAKALRLKGFRLARSNFSQESGSLDLLRTLSLWRVKLSEEEVTRLLKSSDPAVRIATLQYVRILNDPAFLPLVARLVTDADPVVSQAADVACKRLEEAAS